MAGRPSAKLLREEFSEAEWYGEDRSPATGQGRAEISEGEREDIVGIPVPRSQLYRHCDFAVHCPRTDAGPYEGATVARRAVRHLPTSRLGAERFRDHNYSVDQYMPSCDISSQASVGYPETVFSDHRYPVSNAERHDVRYTSARGQHHLLLFAKSKLHESNRYSEQGFAASQWLRPVHKRSTHLLRGLYLQRSHCNFDHDLHGHQRIYSKTVLLVTLVVLADQYVGGGHGTNHPSLTSSPFIHRTLDHVMETLVQTATRTESCDTCLLVSFLS